jgi:hypothetical protein
MRLMGMRLKVYNEVPFTCTSATVTPAHWSQSEERVSQWKQGLGELILDLGRCNEACGMFFAAFGLNTRFARLHIYGNTIYIESAEASQPMTIQTVLADAEQSSPSPARLVPLHHAQAGGWHL